MDKVMVLILYAFISSTMIVYQITFLNELLLLHVMVKITLLIFEILIVTEFSHLYVPELKYI